MRRRRFHSSALFCNPARDIQRPMPTVETMSMARCGSGVNAYS